MFKFICRFFWRFKNRKLLKELRRACEYQKRLEALRPTRLSYQEEIFACFGKPDVEVSHGNR